MMDKFQVSILDNVHYFVHLTVVIKGCNPLHLFLLNTLERSLMLQVILAVVGSLYTQSSKIVL